MILVASVFFPGIIVKTKAVFSGRKGPGILQPWYDIFRLLRKGSVYSTSSSYIFQLGSTVYLGTIVVAALFIPFDQHSGGRTPMIPPTRLRWAFARRVQHELPAAYGEQTQQ